MSTTLLVFIGIIVGAVLTGGIGGGVIGALTHKKVKKHKSRLAEEVALADRKDDLMLVYLTKCMAKCGMEKEVPNFVKEIKELETFEKEALKIKAKNEAQRKIDSVLRESGITGVHTPVVE